MKKSLLFLFLISSFFIFFIGNKKNKISFIQVELVEVSSHWVFQPHWQQAKQRLQSQFNQFIGQKMLKLSYQKIKNIIEAEPFLKSKYIIRLWSNNSYLIGVTPAQSKALLLHTDGLLYPVSLKGALLAPLDSLEHTPDLPILRGLSFFKNQSLRKQALDFLNKLPLKDEALSRRQVSEIHYLEKDNSLNFVLSRNGKKIKVGHTLSKKKVKQVNSVLSFLRQKNILWKQLDASFSKKVVVSTRPKSSVEKKL